MLNNQSMPQDVAYINEVYRLVRATKTPTEARDALTESRYTFLGAGSCAVVVADPDDSRRVLRVSKEPSTDGGVLYLQAVLQKDITGKHLPRVLERIDTDLTTGHALIKYYKSYTRNLPNWPELQDRKRTLSAFMRGLKLSQKAQSAEGVVDIEERYYIAGFDLMRELQQVFPEVTVWDIHSGNVMWDAETQLWILTDPITKLVNRRNHHESKNQRLHCSPNM